MHEMIITPKKKKNDKSQENGSNRNLFNNIQKIPCKLPESMQKSALFSMFPTSKQIKRLIKANRWICQRIKVRLVHWFPQLNSTHN